VYVVTNVEDAPEAIVATAKFLAVVAAHAVVVWSAVVASWTREEL